jgi:hypothetical protein
VEAAAGEEASIRCLHPGQTNLPIGTNSAGEVSVTSPAFVWPHAEQAFLDNPRAFVYTF